jgi:ATP-dependent DNA helicase RecQ
MDEKHKLLKRYWGYDTFRPLQEEIVDSVMQGHDTLALLPTGGGKSLCYQLPALLSEGLCLVVSPLIALMKDQVQQLNGRHLKAACIVSGMSSHEVSMVLNNALCGALKFLYVSPERLRQRSFIEHFRQMKVNLIAVDEAHCVSQWGYDFRPPYLQIAAIRAYHPQVPLLALTATATPTVADDICHRLEMHDCRRYQSSFMRPNLAYMVLHDGDKQRRLLRVLRHTEGSAIVYARNRRGTQALARFLEAEGIRSTFYHAGLDSAERDRRQALWMAGKCRVIVATNAFGMGIDKPDVRLVVHIDLPDSLEAYFQEAGRAGRDGNNAYAVLITDPADITRLLSNFDTEFPSLRQLRSTYSALCNYYRIPVGSGADSHFDFDIERICSTYNFHPRDLYAACRVLERQGLIALPDSSELRSTLHIPIRRDELYRFQVDHQRLGDLLQAIIRIYPGLAETAVPIDERTIARRCYAQPAEVAMMLSQLHAMKVVEYRPVPKMAQIIFTSERIDERSLYPSEESFWQLKESARQRLEAIAAYVANDHRCRCRQLLAYFGEEATADCGVCDVCLHARRRDSHVEEAIRARLAAAPMPLAGLCELMQAEGYGDIRDTLRSLLDRHLVTMDDNGLLFGSSC